jgi:hypothetical protein
MIFAFSGAVTPCLTQNYNALALHQTLLNLADVPARHLVALQQRAELEGASLSAAAPAEANSPFFTMAPNDRSRAPKTKMSKARVIAVRKGAIP